MKWGGCAQFAKTPSMAICSHVTTWEVGGATNKPLEGTAGEQRRLPNYRDTDPKGSAWRVTVVGSGRQTSMLCCTAVSTDVGREVVS